MMPRFFLLLTALLLMSAISPEPDPGQARYLPLVVGHPEVEVIGCQGEPQTWGWLQTTFGPVTVEHGPGPRLLSLACDDSGVSALVVTVRHLDGTPAQGQTVIRYWPDAPLLPPDLQGWRDRGVYGLTKESKEVYKAMDKVIFDYANSLISPDNLRAEMEQEMGETSPGPHYIVAAYPRPGAVMTQIVMQSIKEIQNKSGKAKVDSKQLISFLKDLMK